MVYNIPFIKNPKKLMYLAVGEGIIILLFILSSFSFEFAKNIGAISMTVTLAIGLYIGYNYNRIERVDDMADIVDRVRERVPEIRDIRDYSFYNLGMGLQWIFFPYEGCVVQWDSYKQVLMGKETKTLDMMRSDVEKFEMVKQIIMKDREDRKKYKEIFGGIPDED